MVRFLDSGLVVIRASIGVAFSWREFCDSQLEPYQPDITLMALVDTGAQSILLDETIIERLRLRSNDTQGVFGFDSSISAKKYPVYAVSISLYGADGSSIFQNGDHRVLGAPLRSENYHAVIGNDILREFTMTFQHNASQANVARTV